MVSPLARRLFGLDDVSSVFFGRDFVTVSKHPGGAWSHLKPEVFAELMDHFQSGAPLLDDEVQQEHRAATASATNPEDSEVVAMIKELLDTRIRPSVQDDGGDLVYRGFDEETGVLSLQLVGACRGCASSSVTLKSGVENMLRHYIPEVTSVEQHLDEGEVAGLAEFKKVEARLEDHLSP